MRAPETYRASARTIQSGIH